MPDTKPLVIKFSNGIYDDVEWVLKSDGFESCRYYLQCKSLTASVTTEQAKLYNWTVFNSSMCYMGINNGIVAQGQEPSIRLAMQMCMNVLTSIYDFSEIQSCSKQS
jgi:hypothetical protein